MLDAYWASVQKIGSRDLVVYRDLEDEETPIRVFERATILKHPEIPECLAKRLSKPASELAESVRETAATFWLIVSYPDDDLSVTAISAERMLQGGTA